jgi:hypothetical protein
MVLFSGTAKSTILLIFSVAILVTKSAGQSVLLNPSTSQSVSQPSGTSLGIAETLNTNVEGTSLFSLALNCNGQGYDLGNNGTSAQGWSGCGSNLINFESATRGIDQSYKGLFTHDGQGDTAANYVYLTAFGGVVASSDEGVNHTVMQVHQTGYYTGTVVTPTAGTLNQPYGPTSSGVTYITNSTSSGAIPYFPNSGPLATLSATWARSPATAQTADFIIATPNGSNSYTITSVIPVPLAAGLGEQTFTPSTFGTINVTTGQMIGLYVPTGNGASASSITAICLTGAPSVGTVTFTTSCPTAGIVLQATLAPPSTGANQITTSSFVCHGYCSPVAGLNFADGGIMLDKTQGGSTATITAQGTLLGNNYFTLGTGTVSTSLAWGNIVVSGCTGNGNGQFQTYTSTTCNVTLGVSPASPNNFVSGTDVCLSGPFQEEAAVTAVGTPSGGVQSITFNTRYAWDNANGNTNSALVMQGGLCGQSFVATSSVSSWPVAYAAVGAFNPTEVAFSNCRAGRCNASGGGNIPPIALAITGQASLACNSGVVTATQSAQGTFDIFPIGSTVVISGFTPSSLNGSFTVLTNTYDTTNLNMTWADSSCSGNSTINGSIAQPPTGITFYPSAFITGSNQGSLGTAQLGTNTVPFTLGDTLVGAPTSEFQVIGMRMAIGQSTTVDGSVASAGVLVDNDENPPLRYAFGATNTAAGSPSTVAPEMFYVAGSYADDFYFQYRPANNGTLLFVQGSEPVSSGAKTYNIFYDNGPSSGGSIKYNPTTTTFSFAAPYGSGGAVNSAGGFQTGGTAGINLTCTGGNVVINPVYKGGLLVGGTCGAP